MNGATLLGVGLTILGLSFVVDLKYTELLILSVAGYLYIIASFFAFVIPSLSE